METQKGFSIREYASKMRSANVANCWPFDETASEETIQSLLPPITVKKFTWWVDELQYMRSKPTKNVDRSEKKKKKKKKVLEKGETSFRNEDNVDIDVEESMEAVKMKVPKKRSIVEIFAVAPPVERAFSEEDASEAEADCVQEDFPKGKMNEKKKEKLKKKIKKKKAQKGEDEMGLSVPNEENYFKCKLQTQQKSIGDPSSSHSKELENDIHPCVSVLKRKLKLQHLDAYEKSIPCKASKLTDEDRHPRLPARGILRNHAKTFSQQQSRKPILQEAVQVNSIQKANKQVTFSEKDDKLSRKPSHLWKVCDSDVGNVDDAGCLGKDSTNCIENVSVREEKEADYGPASKEQLTRCIVHSTFTKQVNEEECFSSSGLFCMPLEEYYNDPNIEVIRKSSNSTCRRLKKDFAPPQCFKSYLKTCNEASVSHLSNVERRMNTQPRAYLENTVANDSHSFQFQTFSHLSPDELLQTFRSLPDGYHGGNICGKMGVNGLNEYFVGLPLNSQGELIRLNSSAKRDFNQKMNSSVVAASSAVSKCFDHLSDCRRLDCRTSSIDQLNLFPVESYVKENPVAVIPSRLDIAESQSDSTTNFDLDFLKINGIAFHDTKNTILKEDNNQVQKSPGNEKLQSTMRLMGQEFTVAGRGFQGFEDGHVWKDKHMIDELHFGNDSASNVMVRDQNQPSLGKLTDTLFCPSQTTINHRSENMYPFPNFDSQTSQMYQDVFVARKLDPVQKMYPSFPRCAYSESLSSARQMFSLDIPTPIATHQESCPNMIPIPIQLKSKQSLPQSSISAIRFPFMHQDIEGQRKSSWSRRSSVNHPQFQFDVSENRTQSSNIQSHFTLGRQYPYPMPGSSQGNDLIVMPCYPGVLQVSDAPPQRYGNQKKVKSRVGIGVLDNGNASNIPFKPLKMPTYGFHGDSSRCAIEKPTTFASFGDSVQHIGRAFESYPDSNRTEFVMCSEYEADKEEQIISPWMDSCIDTARIGPF